MEPFQILQNATQSHILAGCNWVRKVENKSKFEDRYTWRHNCVLIVLLETLISQLKVANTRPENEKSHARMVATSILDDLSSAQIDKKTAWSRIRTCQFLRNSLKESCPIKSLEQGLISFLSESKTIKLVKSSNKAIKRNKRSLLLVSYMKPMIGKVTLIFQSSNAT